MDIVLILPSWFSGKWLYLKGNYWKNPFFTSMILGEMAKKASSGLLENRPRCIDDQLMSKVFQVCQLFLL